MSAAVQPVDLLRCGLALLPVIDYEDKYEDQVLAGCREMHAESLLHRDIPMNEAKLLAQLKAPRTHPHVYFKLCERDGELLGGFFGMVSGIYFSDALVAKDLAWFVKPTYRGSLAAISLIADFERWAKAQGVKHVLIGQSTGVRMEATAALYGRLGYQILGANAVKRI